MSSMRYAVLGICWLWVLVRGTWVDGEGRLIAEAAADYVKGFPVILVIEARGPREVCYMDLFLTTAGVEVVLTAKDDARRYVLMGQEPQLEMVSPDGHLMDGSGAFRLRVPAGSVRRQVLDVNMLHGPGPNGVTLRDVPPGTYECLFRYRGVTSNQFDLTLRSPTESEDDVLRVLGLGQRNVRDARPLPVDWAECLIKARAVPDSLLAKLRKETMGQLGLHLLITRVSSSREKLTDIKTEDLEGIEVPAYLMPEKECFLVEMALLSGRKGLTEKRRSELLGKCPGLAWRLEEIERGGRDFLAFKRPSGL